MQPRPQTFSKDWDDGKIVELFDSETAKDSIEEGRLIWSSRVKRICDDTVVKRIMISRGETMPLPEISAQQFVSKHTKIPTPAVYKFFELEGYCYIVMQYIPGKRLSEVWDSETLSSKAQSSVASAIRNYIDQLRSATDTSYAYRNIPGPMVGETGSARNVRGPPWLTVERNIGSLETYDKLAKYCSFVLPRFPKIQPKPTDTPKLVFTHGDLSMHNILIDKEEKVWVVDWEYAGCYPPWFEYIGMLESSEPRDPDFETWSDSESEVAEADIAQMAKAAKIELETKMLESWRKYIPQMAGGDWLRL